MKQAAVCLVLLLASFPLAAQNQVQPQASTGIALATVSGSGCPISMHATQGVWDHTVKVRQGQLPFGQRIRLSLVDSHPAPIVSATVRVLGLTGKDRMLQTAAGKSEADGEKTMNVRFAREQDKSVSGDLSVPGFTSVTSIRLLEVSYDDGNIWKIDGSSDCRVTPDRLMLVATH